MLMKAVSQIFGCLLWLCLAAGPASAAPGFDWQQALEKDSLAAAVKVLSRSEIDPAGSHQHEFHGVEDFRKLLGDARGVFHAQFVYAGGQALVFSESFVSWYNACEAGHYTRCLNRWRIYYPDALALSKGRAKDILMVARLRDGELLFVIAPPEGEAAQWILAHYSHDARLARTPPPPLEQGAFDSVLPQSFTQAKKLLTREIYADEGERRTFYCGCNYARDKTIDPLSCGYVPRRPGSARSRRMEWEHIVPASYIGQGRACWEKGDAECVSAKGRPYKGRRCCEKVDAQFRRIAADPNNLVPEIGELNADRRDYPHGDIPGEARAYGACDFEVDAKLKEAEPAIPLRGFIGRTWLYMHRTYDVAVSDEDLSVYEAWDHKFPAEAWEKALRARTRAALISTPPAQPEDFQK
jgi:deoxyribonuclease-1